MVRVAENVERYDEMLDFLKPILKKKSRSFLKNEKDLILEGFKKRIAGKRTSIDKITMLLKD